MPKNLLIVESPAKASTIQRYLGPDFIVKSSRGHIRDLPKQEDAIDVANGFLAKYEVSPDSKRTVTELKDAMKRSDEVWLATDEDREGEAISWHLCKVLGLDPLVTKRIVFREITKTAIQRAVTMPRTVDLDLVNAQQARRILDRLVGYDLSGVLWKKVKGGLSAGRVQSVAVKLVAERERMIREFEAAPYFRLYADFDMATESGGKTVMRASRKDNVETEGDARKFLEECRGARYSIADIAKRPGKKTPAAPFTTSTLQQEASRKLGMTPNRTMSAAQRLYEAGHITYMRTDSVNLSGDALQAAESQIKSAYGNNYHFKRTYKTNSKEAQEAHEAIRPTDFGVSAAGAERDQKRLYDLIWKRAIASQMADAKTEKTTATIAISTKPQESLVATGEVIVFDGFLRVYQESRDDDDDEQDEDTKGLLPPMKVGQTLKLGELVAEEALTRPPKGRFTEASLVKELESRGIGRPSTYAPTISRIMDPARGYVIKEKTDGTERKFVKLTLQPSGDIVDKAYTKNVGAISNQLVPTDLGLLVVDFLDEHFDQIMNYGFTADIETQFDDIANGKVSLEEVLKDFYDPFKTRVTDTIETAERASGERVLGTDPASGRTLIVRMGRYGPVAQIGKPDELEAGEKPKYGNLRSGQSMEDITMEEALELFKLPLDLGDHKGEPMVANIGRFGPYIKWGETYVNLPKTEDPLELTPERARELVDEKIKADAPVASYKGHGITKGKGRFGPFVKWNGIFVNVPARYNIDTIADQEMFELIEAKVQKEANRYIHNWIDAEGISVENGRWGPTIKYKKKFVKLAPRGDGEKWTAELAKELSVEQVKAMIEEVMPGAFTKKASAKTKSASAKTKTASAKTKTASAKTTSPAKAKAKPKASARKPAANKAAPKK